MNELERAAVLVRAAFAAERQLRLCDHAGERRAQLVRDLGGEALFAPQAGCEPVEEAVERRSELA